MLRARAVIWALLLAMGWKAAMAAEPVTVEVRAVEERSLAELTWFPAVTKPALSATVVAEVSGVLSWVADVGDRVERGGALGTVIDPDRQIRRDEARSAVRHRRAQVELAERRTERMRELVAMDAAAAAELDAAEAELAVAKAELSAAESTNAQAVSEITRAKIKAPFAGLVSARHRREGERLAIGDPLVTIFAPGETEIDLVVPTRYVRALQSSATLQIEMQDELLAGTASAVVPLADGSDRSMVRISMTQNGAVPMGAAVRVGVPVKAAEQAVVVPRDALVIRAEETFVFRVAEDGTAEKVVVDIRLGAGEDVAVQFPASAAALQAGDLVVIRGAETLTEGQDVDPVRSRTAMSLRAEEAMPADAADIQ